MEKRIRIHTNAKWENKIGYSRAIKAGNIIEVSGTSAIDRDRIIAPGDPYQQTRFIIQKIERAINEAGGSLTDIVRTRIYVTNIKDWEAIGRAHGEDDQFRSYRLAKVLYLYRLGQVVCVLACRRRETLTRREDRDTG